MTNPYAGSDKKYAIQKGNKRQQKYPAIQASKRQPSEDETGNTIPLVMSADSVALLGDDWVSRLPLNPMTCRFGKNVEEMIVVPDNLRWVVLGEPRIFAQERQGTAIVPIHRGMKLADRYKTATRLLLAPVLDGHVLSGPDGTPQLVTLRLTSTKTDLVGGDRNDPNYPCIKRLNEKLCQEYGVKADQNSMLHVASVRIEAIATELSNKTKSSMGIIYKFVGGARILPEAEQERMALLASSDEIRKYLADPFGLGGRPGIPVYQDAEEDYPAYPERAYAGRVEPPAGGW